MHQPAPWHFWGCPLHRRADAPQTTADRNPPAAGEGCLRSAVTSRQSCRRPGAARRTAGPRRRCRAAWAMSAPPLSGRRSVRSTSSPRLAAADALARPLSFVDCRISSDAWATSGCPPTHPSVRPMVRSISTSSSGQGRRVCDGVMKSVFSFSFSRKSRWRSTGFSQAHGLRHRDAESPRRVQRDEQ